MITPRTVDEIADQLLPADRDGIHERALCLLLAEHERAIAELREQLPKLPPGEWTREAVERFNGDEPGEEGRRCDGVATPPPLQPSSAAASDQRAPGSTPAPTTEQVEEDVGWLADRYNLAQSWRAQIASRYRALAADRDRLLVGLERMMDLPTTEEAVEVEELRDSLAMVRAQRGHWINAHQDVARDRDTLVRRIEAMARREPTLDELDMMYSLLGEQNSKERWTEVFRYVRTLLATPASEPSEGPCPIREATAQAVKGVSILLRNSPQPAPPSAEDVGWISEALRGYSSASYSQTVAGIAAEVSRREAALRQECEEKIAVYKAASSNANALRVELGSTKQQLEAARAQLAAATALLDEWLAVATRTQSARKEAK